MTRDDTRWLKRFEHDQLVLTKLEAALHLASQRALSELEQQGVIQGFEYTHELGWKVMRDYAQYQGNAEIRGSRDAVRYAFSVDLLGKITTAYHPAFVQFAERMRGLEASW